MRTSTIRASLLVAFFLLSGCSFFAFSNNEPLETKRVWKESGAVVVSRIAPSPSKVAIDSSSLLGFLPMQSKHTGHWLALNRKNRSIEVMDGDQMLLQINAEGIEALEPGTYSVVHKQKDPLWYAPDSYFTSRFLALPSEGSKERYRKGALGDFVIYFDPQIPIHGSLVASDEVGGVRLSNADISRLYYSVGLGSVVEVK